MRREKPPGRQKGARLFSMLLAVCLMIAALPLSVSAAGEYVPGNPRWSGYQNQVQWDRPAGAASGDSFEYEAQLLLGDDVVESKAVEIDTYLFFTNDVVTRPQEEYTIRVRARWIMIVGDPDGQYMVADVGEWGPWATKAGSGGGEAEPPHEHSYTQKHDAAQHWQECSCGGRLTGRNIPASKMSMILTRWGIKRKRLTGTHPPQPSRAILNTGTARSAILTLRTQT